MRCLVVTLMLLPAVTSASTIYKCVDSQGRVNFTDSPCPGSSASATESHPETSASVSDSFGSAISQSGAADLCEKAAMSRAANPSTVNFSRFWSAAFQSFPDGRATYISQFKAKNGFGLELNFDIACYFKGDRLDRVAVSEAR